MAMFAVMLELRNKSLSSTYRSFTNSTLLGLEQLTELSGLVRRELFALGVNAPSRVDRNTSIQDEYDDHLLVLYKLYQDYRGVPYNFFGDNWSTEPNETWLDHVMRSTRERYRDLEERVLPPHVTACYAEVMGAPDRLNLTANPDSRHIARNAFTLEGAGITNGTHVTVGRNRRVDLTLRVLRDTTTGELLWNRCGDAFYVLVRHTGAALPDGVFPRLQRASVRAAVIDNFDGSYQVSFELPLLGDRPGDDGRWEVEVLHEQHRFNGLRPFAGGRPEPCLEYLHTYIYGSPFLLNVTDLTAEAIPRSQLPVCGVGVLTGAWVDNKWQPMSCRLEVQETALEQCLWDRNLCLATSGDSTGRNLHDILMKYVSQNRTAYFGNQSMKWKSEFHHSSRVAWQHMFKNWAYNVRDGRGFPDFNGRAPWMCPTIPGMQHVFLMNAGVHEAARMENHAYFPLAVEYAVNVFREWLPNSTLIWRRTTQVHLRRYPEHDTVPSEIRRRENGGLPTDYANTLTTTRIDLFDLFARRTMAAHNIPILDFLSPTSAAPELAYQGDVRHYYFEYKLRAVHDLIHAALCSGPAIAPIKAVMDLST